MSIEDDDFFFLVDGRLLDAGIQVVVPSLSALLASAPADMVVVLELLGDEGPPLGAVPLDQTDDGIILLQSYFKLV